MPNTPPPDNQLPSTLASVIAEGLKNLRNQPLLFGVLMLAVATLAIVPLSGWGSENQRVFLALTAFIVVVCTVAYAMVQRKSSPPAVISHLTPPLNTPLYLRGYVLFTNNEAVRNAKVYGIGVVQEGYTNDIGAFEVQVRDADSWELFAEYNQLKSKPVKVKKEAAAKDVVLKIEVAEVVIRGTVVDDNGNLVNGVVITFLDVSTTTNRDGYFKITVPKQNSWTIKYTFNQMTQERTLTPADLENLQLIFKQPELPPPDPIQINPPLPPPGRSDAEIQAILNDRIALKNWLLTLSSSELEEIIFESGIRTAHLSQGNHTQRVLDLLGYVERHQLSERFKAVSEKKLKGIG